MTEPIDARALFRAAYENRYTWDEKFPGYSATVTYRQGTATHTATAQINPDFTFSVSDISDETAKKAIHGQVWEIAVHRVRRTFEATHGENQFTAGEIDETGAVEIAVSGKSAGDAYKVRDRQVSLVHRHIHGVVVTINTYSTHQTEAGYLSHRYDSTYRNPQTGEMQGGRSVFEDQYDKIDGYYILTSRVIQTELNGQTSTQEFGFSNIRLLQPAIV